MHAYATILIIVVYALSFVRNVPMVQLLYFLSYANWCEKVMCEIQRNCAKVIFQACTFFWVMLNLAKLIFTRPSRNDVAWHLQLAFFILFYYDTYYYRLSYLHISFPQDHTQLFHIFHSSMTSNFANKKKSIHLSRAVSLAMHF
jgi:hypothetical protein